MNIVKFRFKPEKPDGANGDSLAEAIVCCLIMYLYQYNIRPIVETRAQKRQTATHARRIHSEPAGLRQKRTTGRQTIYNHQRKLNRTIQWLRTNGSINTNSAPSISNNNSSSSSNNNSTSGSSTSPPDPKFAIRLKFSEATVDRNID